jgi:hypothetical protein
MIIIQTTTNRLEESLLFYKKLNFQIVSEEPLLLADNQCIIEVNNHKFARKGIKLFSKDWSAVIPKLQELTNAVSIENGYLLGDSTGNWIYLLNEDMKPKISTEGLSPSLLGNFSGVSLEAIDMEFAKNIYELLGFKITMGGVDKSWMVMANDNGFGISFMSPNTCPHSFFTPSLTYFNNKTNPVIIQKIRDLDISIEEEITAFNPDGVVDNIILRDEGGYGFFVFND